MVTLGSSAPSHDVVQDVAGGCASSSVTQGQGQVAWAGQGKLGEGGNGHTCVGRHRRSRVQSCRRECRARPAAGQVRR